MANRQTQFDIFLAEEIRQHKGIAVPVRTGLLIRLLVRKAPCKKLHPNPDDEFCSPDVGPNYRIISEYEQRIQSIQAYNQKNYFEEPLIVERIRPNGYMLMNGHHRWAAALRRNIPVVPIKIVNLTQEMDIERMLKNSKHQKRVTLDLDDVVFRSEKDAHVEKALPFPWNLIYPQRLRLGIPALFRFLNNNGYDIWVYTSRYASMDDVQRFFRLHRLHVSGVVTGTARKNKISAEAKERTEKLFSNKYSDTLHIDNDMVLHIRSREKTFDEYPLSGSDLDWSREIMETVGKLAQHEG